MPQKLGVQRCGLSWMWKCKCGKEGVGFLTRNFARLGYALHKQRDINDMITIEENVERPERAEHGKTRYHFALLNVNDSFAVSKDLKKSLLSCKYRFERDHEPKKFSVNIDPKDPENKVRCWRDE